MKRIIAALAVLTFLAGPALAQGPQVTNVRASFGPQGATRKDKKVMVRDSLWVNFDVEDLSPDKKSGKLSFQTLIEVVDSANAVKFSQKGGGDFIPALGGTTAPSDFHFVFGDKFPVGKYTVRVTAMDKIGGGKNTVLYPLEIVPSDYGIYGVIAPGTGFRAQDYIFSFGVGQFALDAKKAGNIDVNLRILDKNDKPVGPAIQLTPGQMDDKLAQFVHAMPLNRTGQFTIEVTAIDRNAKNREAKLTFGLNVIDPGAK
jgi:hypothetical protein